MKKKEWDFFMMVEMGPDRLHHGFWKYFDTDHPKYVPGNPYEQSIKDYYLYLDKQVGELIDAGGKDAAALLGAGGGLVAPRDDSLQLHLGGAGDDDAAPGVRADHRVAEDGAAAGHDVDADAAALDDAYLLQRGLGPGDGDASARTAAPRHWRCRAAFQGASCSGDAFRPGYRRRDGARRESSTLPVVGVQPRLCSSRHRVVLR